MTRTAAALPLIALASVAFASKIYAQDDAGQILFNNQCRTCHSMTEGDNRLGPSLHDIIGRKAGSLPGFAYSHALVGSGIVWDQASLDRFIASPEEMVPGNRMKPYGGVASADERAKLIAFLMSQGG